MNSSQSEIRPLCEEASVVSVSFHLFSVLNSQMEKAQKRPLTQFVSLQLYNTLCLLVDIKSYAEDIFD